MPVDFGKTASDYARYRAGFPDCFYDRLFNDGWVVGGDRVLDVGTGTGTVARALTKRGCKVVGLDPSSAMMDQAKVIDAGENSEIQYVRATAEQTGLRSQTFDAITAGTCWHWFDGKRAALEARRLLRPGARLVIASLDWLPLDGNVAEATEALIREYNREWGDVSFSLALDPEYVRSVFDDLARADFIGIESFSFDAKLPYTHEAWLGRIRASAGVAASLPPDQVKRFNYEHCAMLARKFPLDPLQILHRVFAVSGRVPLVGSGSAP